MKKLIFCLGLLVSSIGFAQSQLSGSEGGGGGDASEMRVNEIRSDILKWINIGGSNGLSFQDGTTLEKYNQDMKNILRAKEVIIGFIEKDHETNDELQVNVNGMPKTCRGFVSKKTKRAHILCNIARFEKTSEADQYRLIHHEFAGLVSLEKNNKAASDYYLSEQITNYLTETTVLRLALVEPKNSPVIDFISPEIMAKKVFAVCGATMNSETLGNMSHDITSIGIVYMVELNKENTKTLTNSLYCFSEAKEYKILASRMADSDEQKEIDKKNKLLFDIITTDKFFGKRVNVISKEWSNGIETLTVIQKIIIIK